MNKRTADILLGLTGGLLALSSRSGGANIWEFAGNIPLQVLPSLDKQVRFAGLITATNSARLGLAERERMLQEMGDMILPSIIEGKFKDGQKYVDALSSVYRGSSNRQLKLSDIAEVKTDFPQADFWLQARGSEKTAGKVWRDFSNLGNEYGKTATSASKYDIGIKLRDSFRNQIDPMYLSYLFEYYHLRGIWGIYSYGTLNLQHLRITEVRDFPILLSIPGSINIELPSSSSSSKNPSCWMYNVLTDLPNGLDVNSRKKGKSYPTARSPFDTVALYDIVPHDNPGFTDRFLEGFVSLSESHKKLQDKYGSFRPKMSDSNSCPSYSVVYPQKLRSIENLGVFVHANRHKSSYPKPGKTFVDEQGNQLKMTVRQKSSMTMPGRSVEVGLRGKVMNPDEIPMENGMIDIYSGDFIYFSPFVPYWRKISLQEKQQMEQGIRVDISNNPILRRADMALLTNQSGSRLPFVMVWGGEFNDSGF